MELIMAKKPKNSSVDALPLTYQSMLERALHTLKVLHGKCGIDYAVHSEKYSLLEGTIDLTKAHVKLRKERVRSKLPYGTLTAYYMPFIKDMQPDDLVQVPVGQFDWHALQSSITARGGMLWGRGRVTCVVSKDRTVLEVWRLPDDLEKADMLAPGMNIRRGTGAEAEAEIDD